MEPSLLMGRLFESIVCSPWDSIDDALANGVTAQEIQERVSRLQVFVAVIGLFALCLSIHFYPAR